MDLLTERLRLRGWQDTDFEPFARLNADARVMRYFPSQLSAGESNEMAGRIQRYIAEHGWGLWAVEVLDVASFAGFIGLAPVSFEAHFTPCIEIGWRLGPEFWGRGYATEGALAALDFGFRELHLREIVALTAETNSPSRRVMERIGMTHDRTDDFDHPRMPVGHALRRHVLYRKRAAQQGLQPSAGGAIMRRRG